MSRKVGIVCSAGGHLSEVRELLPALEDFEVFYVTYDTPTTADLPGTVYRFPDTGARPHLLMTNLLKFLRILKDEAPDVLLSTGAELAIPFFYLGKLLEIHLIFIESWTRIDNPTFTARAVYPITDVFLVQWPQMRECFGEKARYWGRIA